MQSGFTICFLPTNTYKTNRVNLSGSKIINIPSKISHLTMQKTMAILFMISGGILFAIGAYQFWAKAPIPASKNHTDEINIPAASQPETDSDPKIDGLDFEKYIVQRFNKKYFTIKQWEEINM